MTSWLAGLDAGLLQYEPLSENGPDLGLHGPAVPCGLDTQPRA
jgi:hypothetical protein